MEATIKKARLGERQRRKPDFENYQEYSHLVELSEAGGIPAIWTGTTNVRWMQNNEVKAKILKACGIEPQELSTDMDQEIAPVVGNFDSKASE